MSDQARQEQFRQQTERLEEFRRRNQEQQNEQFDFSGGHGSGGSTMRANVGLNPGYQPVKDALIPQHIYSPSGYDILSILMCVRGRPNPVIQLGNVDTSVALVLCDAEKSDCPIVYCSEYFERLTGYCQNEILGKNCRFLQIPPQDMKATLRLSIIIENERALKLFREKLKQGLEAQVTLVNFRKDGNMFVNILTTIPIKMKADGETGPDRRYVVGFQVDKEKGLFGKH
ncbi:hypothetical protein HYALB_00004653 [Hymenoscyphus albidus]|uniref:PAS domain-containing protein n=1 Tax=Hymenoscyphus albidus TaxID=595503 RepID=A0A9N9LU58_9HELO|nr:hypothetical protein HYALB_00004653 [Hymenoscyphus albidus]